MSLNFRWETFNLFNHVQYGGPGGTSFNGGAGSAPISLQNGGTFGEITSQANDPRIQQVSLRLTF